MTDATQPSADDWGDPSDFILNSQRHAQMSALTSLDADPEEAARAQELSEATGANPALVYGDVEGFEQQHKAALTSELLKNNQFLAQYATSHPLAAKISNDDWGQLDTISQAITKFQGSGLGRALDFPTRATTSVLGAATQGFKDNTDLSQIGKWADEPDTSGFQQAHPYLYGLAREMLKQAGIPAELMSQAFSGTLGAVHGGLAEIYRQTGGDPNKAEGFANEMTAMAEAELGGLSGRHGVGEPVEGAVEKVQQATQKVSEAVQAAKPFADAGVEPPVGIHPVIDQLHAEQAKLDGKNLDDLFSEAQSSTTKARSPDLFADFIRQHTDASIGIDAEAVRKLYGDKVPEADDNLLGWVPRIQEQLALAEAHGGDVDVPLADWVAKADPEVAKELHDDIRVRPGGMTLEEAKEGEKPIELVEEEQPQIEGEVLPAQEVTPVDSIRSAAKLDPLFAPTDSVKLGKEEAQPQATFLAGDMFDHFNPDDLTQVPRALYDFFGSKFKQMAGDVPVKIISDEDMLRLHRGRSVPAHYNPDTHEIVMASRVVDGTYPTSNAAHLLFHETTHAITAHAIYQDKALEGKIKLMQAETRSFLTSVSPEDLVIHNYAFTSPHEFIAEAFSNPKFQEILAQTEISKDLAKDLGIGTAKPTAWEAIRQLVKRLVEKAIGVPMPQTMLDGVMKLGEHFEDWNKSEGGKETLAELKANRGALSAEEEPELPGMTRLESKKLFKTPGSIGMSAKRLKQWMSAIEELRQEDAKRAEAKAAADAAERQTKEWKENYPQVRAQVTSDLTSRPDLAADRFLQTGELYGEKGKKVKLARGEIPPELAKRLPADYLGTDGIHPDDMAGLFGYQSGDAMVGALANLEDQRKLEGLTPAAFMTRLVDAETDRQMRKEFGKTPEDELADAKDQALSPGQMDLIAQEMLALGEKAHGEISISKEDVKAWVKEQFNATPLGSHSSDKYLAAAGRAGQEAENGLLDGNPKDAFKAKQQQYVSTLLAKEALRLEKEKAQFSKLAKRFSRREVGGVPPEYTNWIHDILIRTGNVVRRSVQDLQDAIGRETDNTLEKFVNAKNTDSRIWEEDGNNPSDFQVMPVVPFLFDQNYRTTLDKMTPDEFRAVHNSIKTIAKNGSDENKIVIAGEKQDLAQTIDRMVGQLENLFAGKEKQYAFWHKDAGIGHAIRTAWASLLQIESIFNRFDKGDPKGIFSKAITQPIFDGSHELSTLETKYSKMYRTIKFDKADLKRKVDNTVFGDPLHNWEKRPFTRENLLAVLQNVGNPSQLDKLARGYMKPDERGRIDKQNVEQFKTQIMQWLFRNTTKEDWDRAQALGGIFEQAFEESAAMYHSLSGVAPEKIDIRPIQTPFGEYKGWYHPLIYDPLRPGSSKKLMGQDPLEDGSYYRVATPSGYTKRRTGYAAPIQLNLEAIPHRLSAMLRDTAMRPPVTETAKVFYNPKWQMAITKSYGKETTDLMLPYLKDIAGQKQYKDAAQATVFRILEAARQNISATLIGLNPSTVMKHAPTAAMLSIKEVGVRPFLNELTHLLSTNDELGERNWTFAMHGGIVDGRQWNGSEELQRRQRNWQETLTGSHADVFGKTTLRDAVIKFGATPVAISDLLSAVPTWLASYKQQIRAGEEHGDAVAFADRAVRRAHGSSATVARPRVMRGGPLAQFATPFYTFFNEMFQRQYEMAWRAKDTLGEFNEGNYRAGLAEVPNLAKGLWAYVVFPALVEQMVSPLETGNESTTEKALAYGARTISSSIPVLRDLVEAFLGNRDPTIGLYSTALKAANDFIKDIAKGNISLNKQHAGATIKHTLTAFGAASGLTNAQEGRTGEFVYDYATGKQRPKDIHEILHGLWHGTIKEPKR